MRTVLAAAVTALVVVAGGKAGYAQQAKAAAPEYIEARPPPTVRSFYGFPIIAVGEAGALLTSAALVLPDRLLSTAGSTVGFIAGAPTFLLAGPVVHWTHGEFTKGLVSFGANLTLPVLAGFTSSAITCSGDSGEDCGYHAFGAGFAVTALLLPIADALVLGWEEVPADETSERPDGARVFTLFPRVEAERGGGVRLGIMGVF